MSYSEFIGRKFSAAMPCGFVPAGLPASLFPMQRDLAAWAIKRGRAAIFADTGLGKSRMGLSWADAVAKHSGRDVIGFTPLAVAQQTVLEGAAVGIQVTHCREESDLRPGINIANYERMHKFDPARFGAVWLDESSIIKHHDTKTFHTLTASYGRTPYKLCTTATPAPNDWTELGTHAEFLGICSRAEMLAEFFTHDGGETSVWRLKGHAREVFWKWVVAWGALIRRPSDLGYDDTAYNLPPLILTEHLVKTQMPTNGMLFAFEAQTLSERRDARRMSLVDRVDACVNVIAGDNLGKKFRLHEEVLRDQQIEVGSDAGAKRASQCIEAEAICGERAGASCGASGGQELAESEPGEAQVPTGKKVRARSVGRGGPAGDAAGQMRDLRSLGPIECELLSSSGSLPQNGESARPALHELQPGVGQVQGRSGPAFHGHCVPYEKWLIWCELNDEQDLLEKKLRACGITFVSIRGSTDLDKRVEMEREWRLDSVQVMISKPSVFGWGLNWQHCARMAFVGVTDSFEAYYQAVRRCWRFGQKREVHVHIFASEAEGAIVANLKRKEREATAMAESLSAETREAVTAEIRGASRQTNLYAPASKIAVPSFLRAA